MRTKTNKKFVGVRVSSEMKQRITEHASRQGMSVSAFLASIIRAKYLASLAKRD